MLVSWITSGCSIAPTHPSLAETQLPKLIPVRKFVANVDYNDSYQISPDGQKITWNGVSVLRPAILWRELDRGKTMALRFSKGPPYPIWAADSRHILYHSDPSGRENHHIFAVDTLDPKKTRRDLTPYTGVKAFIARVPSVPSDVVYVYHNQRDRAIFDLYAINIVSGEQELLYQNNDNIVDAMVDDNGRVRARVRQTQAHRLLEAPDGNGVWKTLVKASKFDQLSPTDLSQDGTRLFLLSNVERDKLALIELNLDTGKEEIIFQHNDVDIIRVLHSPLDRRPLLALTEPGYPEMTFFDDSLKQRLTPLIASHEINGIHVMSLDRRQNFATIVSWNHAGASFYLVDLVNGKRLLLGKGHSVKFSNTLVEKKPITFKASDGMRLYGYLSLPKVRKAEHLPTVLLVHGGPWFRDRWGYDTVAQFLANRGYAVIQINYRGSSGYGRRYMHAAEGEFAGKMHDDLIDAIDWAIAKGISDPTRVAIVGASYGGYATLVGMTMTPEKFACGVDNVGISDLATLIESAPAYWQPWMHMWDKFVGDPSDPEQRRIMDAKSPLNYAHQVQGPIVIFHGVNDPRVKLDQSDRMVKALQAANKQVDYTVIKDEGHGYMHWKNELKYFRKVEDFLAQCLGGRSSGFDFYQLGSWMF